MNFLIKGHFVFVFEFNFWRKFLAKFREPLKGLDFFAFANAKKMRYTDHMKFLFVLFSALIAPLGAHAGVGDKADTNSDYIVILLTFIFLITLLDFLRRIFGQGGNRP